MEFLALIATFSIMGWLCCHFGDKVVEKLLFCGLILTFLLALINLII